MNSKKNRLDQFLTDLRYAEAEKGKGNLAPWQAMRQKYHDVLYPESATETSSKKAETAHPALVKKLEMDPDAKHKAHVLSMVLMLIKNKAYVSTDSIMDALAYDETDLKDVLRSVFGSVQGQEITPVQLAAFLSPKSRIKVIELGLGIKSNASESEIQKRVIKLRAACDVFSKLFSIDEASANNIAAAINDQNHQKATSLEDDGVTDPNEMESAEAIFKRYKLPYRKGQETTKFGKESKNSRSDFPILAKLGKFYADSNKKQEVSDTLNGMKALGALVLRALEADVNDPEVAMIEAIRSHYGHKKGSDELKSAVKIFCRLIRDKNPSLFS